MRTGNAGLVYISIAGQTTNYIDRCIVARKSLALKTLSAGVICVQEIAGLTLKCYLSWITLQKCLRGAGQAALVYL